MNPSWDYRFYDDDDVVDFIGDNFGPRILGYFNRIHPAYGAARADLFRYLLMYKIGGVYLDLKSAPTVPLDTVLMANDRYLLSGWRNGKGDVFPGFGIHAELRGIPGGEFQQWHIVAAPGHPFLKAVIENVLRNIDCYNPALHGTGRLGVLRVTGPIAYTLAIAPLLNLHPHRFVDSQNEMGFEYSVLRGHGPLQGLAFKPHYSTQEGSITIGYPNELLALGLRVLRSARRSLQLP